MFIKLSFKLVKLNLKKLEKKSEISVLYVLLMIQLKFLWKKFEKTILILLKKRYTRLESVRLLKRL